MKLFKSTEEATDGYTVLLSDLRQTTADLRNAYTNLENVVDPDLIDYYIYQAKAVQMRYKFLLDCMKTRGSSNEEPSVSIKIHIAFIQCCASICHSGIHLLCVCHKRTARVLFGDFDEGAIQALEVFFRLVQPV